MRDCGGRHFHSFTHILYTDCGTAVAGIFTLLLISYILTVGHAGLPWQARIFTLLLISYILTVGHAGLRWQAFSLFHSYLIY